VSHRIICINVQLKSENPSWTSLTTICRAPSPNRRMSKRPTPGSGLRSVALIKAISALEELEKLSQQEEAEWEGVEVSQRLAVNVLSKKTAELTAMLKANADDPLVSGSGLAPFSDFLTSHETFPLSNIDFDVLDERFNISPGNILVHEGDQAKSVDWSVGRGGDTYMTSKDMYRHLNMLANLVPTTVHPNFTCWFQPHSSAAATVRGGCPLVDRYHVLSGGSNVVGQQEHGTQSRTAHPISLRSLC
jgi:hypothetical protein